MTAQLTHQLLLLGAATSFSLALFIVLLSLSKRLKGYQQSKPSKVETSQVSTSPASSQASEKSLLVAEETAREMIRNAEKEASEILKRAKTFDQETIEEVDKTLVDIKLAQQETIENIAQNIVRSYTEVFATLRNDNINTLKNVSKEVEKQATAHLETFTVQLSKETAQQEAEVTKKINASYNQVLQELEAYKLSKMQRIDQNMQQMLESVLKNVLGKTIPLTEHHKIILDALEKAKKEGVFDHGSK